MSRKKESRPTTIRHYEANYGNFQTELYEQIRKEAFGHDIGQNSWLTSEEHDRFIPWLNLSDVKTLLDVACGSGGPALRIAEKTGCSVVGVDLGEEAISTANSLAEQRMLKERVHFQLVDATRQLPFPDATFDTIICIDAINHLSDRKLVFSEWTRILKLGGRLLFTDPVIITGPISASEIAVRSSIGFFLFVPPGYNERLIADCGLHLLWSEDVTANTAIIAERRRVARAARTSSLRKIEGKTTFEGQQKFLAAASRLAQEKRLSRFVYAVEK